MCNVCQWSCYCSCPVSQRLICFLKILHKKIVILHVSLFKLFIKCDKTCDKSKTAKCEKKTCDKSN